MSDLSPKEQTVQLQNFKVIISNGFGKFQLAVAAANMANFL